MSLPHCRNVESKPGADPYSVPAGVLVILTVILIFPKLEHQLAFTLSGMVKRVDWLGLTLCLGASLILIIPLQEAGAEWAWDSTGTIAMLAVGGACWAAFASWQWWLSREGGVRAILPMLPKHVVLHRVVAACTM